MRYSSILTYMYMGGSTDLFLLCIHTDIYVVVVVVIVAIRFSSFFFFCMVDRENFLSFHRCCRQFEASVGGRRDVNILVVKRNYWRTRFFFLLWKLTQSSTHINRITMGNKNGTYDTLMEETKQLLMQRTGRRKCQWVFQSNFFCILTSEAEDCFHWDFPSIIALPQSPMMSEKGNTRLSSPLR